MRKQTRQRTWSAIAGLACAIGISLIGVVEAGTTIGFGSSVGATNLTSSGEPMHDGFVFQLGTFEDDFEPGANNTADWLGRWRPASDREGEPLEGNTVPYQTRELGGVFPEGLRANNFTGSVTLDHNEPPFELGGQLYIWGYDQRATAGAAEWILITDPSWIWPDGGNNLPATSYAVSGAASAILGEISGAGFEMKSAAVTVPDSSADFYEGWLAQNFAAAVLGDPSKEAAVWGRFADPDKDGLTNLMEYFTGGDPRVASTADVLDQPQISGDQIVLQYRRSLSAIGVLGQVEWSVDLKSWSREGVEQVDAGEDETHVTVRVTWPLGEASRAYFRLTAQPAP